MSDRLWCAETANGGGPCRASAGFVVLEGDGVARCLTHTQDATRARRRDERNARGGAGRVLTLATDTRKPDFSTRRRVVKFTEDLAHLVLTGQLDPRLSAEARGCASVAMTAHELDALERLDKLEARVLGRRRTA